MSKKDGGWILPNPVDPGARRCICIPVPDSPEHRQAFAGALLELGYWFNWQRDDAHTAVPVSVLWMEIVTTALARFYEGGIMCFTCEELNDCLQPLYDQITNLSNQVTNLQTNLTTVTEQVTQIENNQAASIAQNPATVIAGVDPVLCGAVGAVVDYMHLTNQQVYSDAEGGIWDTLMEAFVSVTSVFASLKLLPAQALAALTQSYFENQVADYNADFALARTDMIKLLYCAVLLHDGEFTYDVWGDWLDALDSNIPDNRAASVFSRYAPVRQTFINQLAQAINRDISLEEFFENLYAAFETGKGEPSGLCASAACGGTCAVRYFDGSQHGWAPLTGNTPTEDTAGWYLSGPYTGFSNPEWVIGEDMTIDGDYTAFHVDTLGLTKNPVNYNTLIWYYDAMSVQHTFDVFSPEMTVIEDGESVKFIVDLVTPVTITGWGFNTNDDTAGGFRVTGAQVCT